jgi:nucleoid-associated protein YgaU
MKKDFKIGLLLGLVLVSIAGIWLCVSPTTSVRTRLGNLQKSKITPEAKKQEPGPILNQPADSDSKSTQTSPVQEQIPDNKETENIPDEASIKEEPTTNTQLYIEDITRFHTVREDETLSGIALKYYGSANKWTKIRDANPKVNPRKLQPGTTLIIPP